MAKYSSHPALVILDKDLNIAASYLADADIKKQINNCFNMLMYTYFYKCGIKKQKIYKIILEQNNNILEKIYPNWNFPHYLETIPKAKNKEFKFVKMCNNHYTYVLKYALILCDEFKKRFNKNHPKSKYLYWIEDNLPELPKVDPDKYSFEYPISTIPIKFRKVNYIESARNFYKNTMEDPISEYNKASVPDFFEISTNISQYS